MPAFSTWTQPFLVPLLNSLANLCSSSSPLPKEVTTAIVPSVFEVSSLRLCCSQLTDACCAERGALCLFTWRRRGSTFYRQFPARAHRSVAKIKPTTANGHRYDSPLHTLTAYYAFIARHYPSLCQAGRPPPGCPLPALPLGHSTPQARCALLAHLRAHAAHRLALSSEHGVYGR